MRSVYLAGVTLLVLAASSAWRSARAQDGNTAKSVRSLMRLLDEEMQMADFTAPMTLKETVELVMAKYAEKNKLLPILVDAEAFARADGPNVHDARVVFAPIPKRLDTWTLLGIMLGQVEPGNATFLIRRGAVVITTKENASFAYLRQQKARSAFYNQPLIG